MLAIASFGLYGVIIYGEHIVGYVIIDDAGLTIYSEKLIFSGYHHVPEFKTRSVIQEVGSHKITVFENYKLDQFSAEND